ncbi:hypothetical protein ABVT39_023917 [Epinephelus coioides]
MLLDKPPKRKGVVEKLREKRHKNLQADAAKCVKISDMFAITAFDELQADFKVPIDQGNPLHARERLRNIERICNLLRKRQRFELYDSNISPNEGLNFLQNYQ